MSTDRSRFFLGLAIGGLVGLAMIHRMRERDLKKAKKINSSAQMEPQYSLLQGTAGGLIGSGSITFIFL